MGDSMGLEKGKQVLAAQQIIDGIPGALKSLQTMGTSVETHAAGIMGSAAAGLVAVFEEWGKSAEQLQKALVGYAAKLATVDENAVKADNTQAQAMASSGGGLHMMAE